MELAQCRQNVYAASPQDFIELQPKQLVFKKGYVYPVFKEKTYWITQDEEGMQHVIADSVKDLHDDLWFRLNFKLL